MKKDISAITSNNSRSSFVIIFYGLLENILVRTLSAEVQGKTGQTPRTRKSPPAGGQTRPAEREKGALVRNANAAKLYGFSPIHHACAIKTAMQ